MHNHRKVDAPAVLAELSTGRPTMTSDNPHSSTPLAPAVGEPRTHAGPMAESREWQTRFATCAIGPGSPSAHSRDRTTAASGNRVVAAGERVEPGSTVPVDQTHSFTRLAPTVGEPRTQAGPRARARRRTRSATNSMGRGGSSAESQDRATAESGDRGGIAPGVREEARDHPYSIVLRTRTGRSAVYLGRAAVAGESGCSPGRELLGRGGDCGE